MTDKLQDVVDVFIASAHYPDGDKVPCIAVHDLRAFLAQYVVCNRESVVFALGVIDGRLDANDGSHPYFEEAAAHADSLRDALHAPAKVPE